MSNSSAGSVATNLVALVIVAAIAAGSWLFYFGPTFDEISELKSQSESQSQFNDTFRAQVAALAREYEMLPELESNIRDVKRDLPPIEDAPAIVRIIDGIVRQQTSTTIMRIEFGTAAEVLNTITLQAAYAERGGTSYVESLEFEGLYATTVTLEILGPRSEFLSILDELQTGDHRFLLVQDVGSFFAEPGEERGSRPEVLPGYVEATIGIVFFTLSEEGVDPRFLPGEDGDYPLWGLEDFESALASAANGE